MKKTAFILTMTFFIAATWAFAAEKSKVLVQLDASRAAVDALAGKVGENREALTALEQARSYVQKATDVQTKSRQLFGVNIGFGDLKPEAEEEIKNYLEISDIAVATVTSRLEKARAASELEIIDKQSASVMAKIKAFEDRKAELEKLKADAAKCQSASKELEILKSENSRLSGQIEKQLAEIKTLTTQLEEAKKNATLPATPEKNSPAPATIIPAPVKEMPAAKEQPAPVKETPAQK